MSSQLNTDLLTETWGAARELGDEVPLRFYAILFFKHPETRPMFPPGMAAQRDKLVRAIGTAVSHINDLDAVAPTLRKLGRDHRRFGAKPEHYGAVLEALLSTLAICLGERWTEDCTDAWSQAYQLVAEVMIEAATEQADDGIPPWWDATVTDVERSVAGAAVAIAVATNDQPETYKLTDGCRLDVMPGRRPGLWTKAAVQRTGSDEKTWLQVRHSSGLDFAAMAIASLPPGALLRIGPPTTEPFDPEETDAP